MKIYLANPFGFSEAGREFLSKIKDELERLGYEVLEPFELNDTSELRSILQLSYGVEKKKAWEAQNKKIFAKNVELIKSSDCIFAVLDGVDVDSGTASEIGFAYGLGKPILGYCGDFRLSADNEGSIVNLQVEGFIKDSGGTIISSFDQIKETASKLFGK